MLDFWTYHPESAIVLCLQKAESDVEVENDGEEAAVGALESLALGHHHQHMKGRAGRLQLPQMQYGEYQAIFHRAPSKVVDVGSDAALH